MESIDESKRTKVLSLSNVERSGNRCDDGEDRDLAREHRHESPMCHGMLQRSRLVLASVRDTRRRKPAAAFSRARENTRIDARRRRHAVRCDAMRWRLLQTALSTWFLNAPPFYVFTIPSTSARPLLAAYPAPLFTDREGKQPSSVTCYCSYANRLHSWSNVVHAHTRAGSNPEMFALQTLRAGVRGPPSLQKRPR